MTKAAKSRLEVQITFIGMQANTMALYMQVCNVMKFHCVHLYAIGRYGHFIAMLVSLQQ